VIKSDQSPSKEPLFMFAGGPGQGSTDMAGLASGPLASVLAVRDIVLVDQRGTGGSNPLRCEVDLVAHPELAFGHVFDPALFRRCRPELERVADLRFYTTALAVEDIDDIRRTLGYDRILVWGGSYGTRLAQAYMRAHPDRVAAAVLDGVVPFDFHAPAGYARSAQQSLDRVLADCRARPECDRANPGLPAAFGRLVARLRSGPVAATVRRPDQTTAPVELSLGDFGYAVRGILYSSGSSRGLPAMIHAADSTGDLSPFAQRYWGRAADFKGFADGLHFAIFCAEDIPFIEDRQVDSLTRGTFIGTYLIDEYRAVCRDWVRAPVAATVQEPLRVPVPTLLLSGWFDPVTPPETGARVAAGLVNHRHLVIRNEDHGSGFGCARAATMHVLVRATLEGLPAVCDSVTNLWDH
jgi:pimeloyl-ACP methyl ester carboxylesterase